MPHFAIPLFQISVGGRSHTMGTPHTITQRVTMIRNRMTHTWAWIISQTIGHMVENFISMELFVMYLRRGGVISMNNLQWGHFFSVAIFFLCTCVSHSVKVLIIKFFDCILCYRVWNLGMFCLIWQFNEFLVTFLTILSSIKVQTKLNCPK